MNIFLGIILFIWFFIIWYMILLFIEFYKNKQISRAVDIIREEYKKQLQEFNEYDNLLDYIKKYKEDIKFYGHGIIRIKFIDIYRVNGSDFYIMDNNISPNKYKNIKKEILKYLEDLMYGVKEKK